MQGQGGTTPNLRSYDLASLSQKFSLPCSKSLLKFFFPHARLEGHCMKPGTRVIDRWNHAGVVRKIYDDFSACAAEFLWMTGEEWLEKQAIPFTREQVAEQWASVMVDGGGSICSPCSLLQEV